MGFNTGIVGLPNVGKSTLFNALTRTSAAQAANFPFCTIEPNSGEVAVPDPRLGKIATISAAPRMTPAKMTFIDIAGLVRNASKGEGLGNQFLANIREVEAIAHVIRCFENEDVVHVHGVVDPLADIETIETELMIADLESIERRKIRNARKVKSGDKEAVEQDRLLRSAYEVLSEGQPARCVEVSDSELRTWRGIRLLSAKPVLFVCNVDEESVQSGNDWSDQVVNLAQERRDGHVIISASIEEEINQLKPEESRDYLTVLGLSESGLERTIRAGYSLLGLKTFFTTGPKEARAWTIRAGTPAREAAGAIHGDFSRGFIRAETISFKDYVAFDGEQGAREAGKLRSEGKTYQVEDGDVIHFLFNV